MIEIKLFGKVLEYKVSNKRAMSKAIYFKVADPIVSEIDKIANILNHTLVGYYDEELVRKIDFFAKHIALVHDEYGTYYWDKESGKWVFKLAFFDEPVIKLTELKANNLVCDYVSLFFENFEDGELNRKLDDALSWLSKDPVVE